ncbi:MAG TPA: hypothetical protein VGS17_08320 [Candidatus Limnocylindria bacterium]|nr:hypothetical protein [Candidatus Limnocylindria bacterium]
MRILAAALLVVALGACALPQFGGVSVDYVDFVKWNGIDYLGSFTTVGRAIADGDLGPEYFRVKQTLVTAHRGIDYQIQDGDAAFVPTGEPVYTLRGYAPTFRLAARHDGRLVLYEVHMNPAAKQGRELLDIEAKVSSIAILDQKRNTTVIGRISEPARVATLVGLVLDAPVGGPAPIAPSAGLRPPPVFATVSFELNDGTATVRGYDLTTSTLTPNITVAAGFREAIATLVANAPTPTPAPALVNLARRYDLAQAQSVIVKRSDRPGAQPVRSVAEWSSALDGEMPARRAGEPQSGDIVVIFSFPDRYVSLVYDGMNETIRVAVPDDELAVRATDAFKALLARD